MLDLVATHLFFSLRLWSLSLMPPACSMPPMMLTTSSSLTPMMAGDSGGALSQKEACLKTAANHRKCKQTSHTPPEGWVRAKKFFITFDTNFERYLPRGTIIDGSRKCRIGAFCTIAKISREMSKKGLKNRPKWCQIFLWPPNMLNNNICGNFIF